MQHLTQVSSDALKKYPAAVSSACLRQTGLPKGSAAVPLRLAQDKLRQAQQRRQAQKSLLSG